MNNSAATPAARLLLVDLNSFTGQRERADEFGDVILTVESAHPIDRLLLRPAARRLARQTDIWCWAAFMM
ncbi:MAG: hypothetical protein U1E47_03320 [Rivihabitans pingtungensis]